MLKAECPLIPDPINKAKSSLLDSPFSPYASAFSRGRSSGDKSLIRLLPFKLESAWNGRFTSRGHK
jgi:hypothetical protein